MPPTDSETDNRNNILFQLNLWAKKNKIGICFDSSTGFTLPSYSKNIPIK